MKKIKKSYNSKNQQHAKYSILLRDYSTWVSFEQSTSTMSQSSVVSTLTFPVLTPEFILLPPRFRLSISEKPIIAYKSSLFCKLCCPCHFWCHAFVQRMLLPMPISMLTFSMSLAYLQQVSVWSISYVLSTHSGSVLMLDDVGCINALLPMVSPHRLQLIIWDRD